MKMLLKYNPKTGNWVGKLNKKKLQQDAHNDYMKDKFKKQARTNRQDRL